MKQQIVREANKISELSHVLENISHDDKVSVESMTREFIVSEARHVLGLFREGGTSQSEMLDSDDSVERREARKQVKALERFIQKYSQCISQDR
jgi:hypothetical protein